MPGVYTESITLNIEITLQGYDPYTTKIFSGGNAITVISGAGNCVIEGFDIQGGSGTGNCAIINSNQNASPVIINNIINNCNRGIYSDNRLGEIRNNLILNCGDGIRLHNDGADGTICNNVIYGCSEAGILLENYGSLTPDPIVYSNVIISNYRGIWLTSNTTVGTFTYNNVWDNSSGNWVGNITQGPGNISEDPLFVDMTNSNYHLQYPDSPCIDSGIPGDPHLDPNGTRNDMGAYGGPDCLGGGGPGITEIEITPLSVPQGGTIDIEASGTVQ